MSGPSEKSWVIVFDQTGRGRANLDRSELKRCHQNVMDQKHGILGNASIKFRDGPFSNLLGISKRFCPKAEDLVIRVLFPLGCLERPFNPWPLRSL